MAVVAVDATRNMRCVLAQRGNAVVAGATSSQHLRVIDRGDWNERTRAVTVFADICCLHVYRDLAGRGSAVMAADAIAENAGVVEIRREPACRIVTIFALIPG